MSMEKREIRLTLIIDNDEPSINEIRHDLEQEINCASYYYEVINVEEVKGC